MRPERLYLQDMVEAADNIAFRNLVVHEYFGLDWSIVLDTATTLVPVLRDQIAGVLSAEFQGTPV